MSFVENEEVEQFWHGVPIVNSEGLSDSIESDTVHKYQGSENFVNNQASLNFVVYHKQDKACILIIEVDSFEFHENNSDQLRRDTLKDSILGKYGVPILRFATNGSGER